MDIRIGAVVKQRTPASSETATVSHGAIDGAIRSGQRAAAEVLTAER
ncbi:MAG TPA: FAD-dependent oxidoreductase [Dehalococcoidia bacterium]|nr:FAD-dependent oxidoreductase [Dehalococcoidia bacterium]